MSSKKEQAALVAFFNSFGLSKRLTSFEQLSDGKVFMEVMSKVDAAHFRNAPARTAHSEGSWVLKMNTMKRFYRLLLSFPLPSPHPSSLTFSTLPEPPFNTIAQAPSSAESIKGLVQISRMCLSVSVWAPGNEKVIARIQSLGEGHMAELMAGIEEIMATLPAREESDSAQSSPVKKSRDSFSPPPSGLRAERDKLLQENDELRQRCEQLITQIAETSSNLDEANAERDEAVARFQKESAGSLRTSQTASSDSDALRADLAKAEENLAQTEADLEKQLSSVRELTKQVEEFKQKADQAAKYKDQLDEYRHAADKLQKAENVIEKYKKKLEDSAGLRRELRNLEEENASLVETNSKLEAELKKAQSSRSLIGMYEAQIRDLELKQKDQTERIEELNLRLEHAYADIEDKDQAYEREREALQQEHDRARELELRAGADDRSSAAGSSDDHVGNTSLGDELGATEFHGDTPETKTSLKLRIRALERELAEARKESPDMTDVTGRRLLDTANKLRDKYQADYFEAYRDNLRLEARLDAVLSGSGTDKSSATVALRQRLDELQSEYTKMLSQQEANSQAKTLLQDELKAARTDLSLVDQDEQQRIAALRRSLGRETEEARKEIEKLRLEVDDLKENDRVHLQEIKRLLSEKVDLQSLGLSQREKELQREREFSDIRAQLAKDGVNPQAQANVIELHTANAELSAEVKTLSEKLQKAKDFIRNQDALFRADHAQKISGNFDEVQKSYESQISALKQELLQAKQSASALQQRYKLEQQLMLSAWHELGSRTVRDHLTAAGQRKNVQRPVATSWLGRQRKQQEDAVFSR